MDIYSDISNVKGVGPKTCEILKKCLIFNILDLLLYFPRDYEIIHTCNIEGTTNTKGKVILKCTVEEVKKDIRTKTGKILSTVTVENNGEVMEIKWFNQPYIKNHFVKGKEYTLMGKIEQFKGRSYLINPKILNNNINYDEGSEQIIPKYPLTTDLKNSTIIKIIKEVLEHIDISENMPKWIIDKYNFCSLDKAIRNIHFPKNIKELEESKKRLKFQELFTYSLKILVLKEFFNTNDNGIEFRMSPELTVLKESLPFKLTNAQSKVVREILIDQKKKKPTNRLVQGDVGSGKTIVALIAIFNVVMNGYQGVLMAPTEILATQHYEEAKKLFKNFNFKIELLVGSVSAKNKENIKNKLKSGEIDLIIGTHALLEDSVEFDNLGIVVTDEQHRFGVMQRSKLYNKGKSVEVLVMTATPIPRTLALYLYGDLDVSIIDELPPGRQKIETFYVNKSDKFKVYNFALKEIKDGRQVYIVCPLIEENEKLELTSVENLFNELKEKFFKEIPIAILHGKMTPSQKDEIMNKFKQNEIKAIVSTTVIEVGINVPNATMMIIENAERFGLSQLHQLRGRVGRGVFKSYCALIADAKNDVIRKRMEIMCSTNNGFIISEEDLKLRGSGELFGIKQHGEDGLILADIMEDINLLKEANIEAKRLINSKEELDINIKSSIVKKLEQSSKFICFN